MLKLAAEAGSLLDSLPTVFFSQLGGRKTRPASTTCWPRTLGAFSQTKCHQVARKASNVTRQCNSVATESFGTVFYSLNVKKCASDL